MRDAVLREAMVRYAMLCYAMPCYATPCLPDRREALHVEVARLEVCARRLARAAHRREKQPPREAERPVTASRSMHDASMRHQAWFGSGDGPARGQRRQPACVHAQRHHATAAAALHLQRDANCQYPVPAGWARGIHESRARLSLEHGAGIVGGDGGAALVGVEPLDRAECHVELRRGAWHDMACHAMRWRGMA